MEMIIKFRKDKKSCNYIPLCANCEVDIVLTELPDKVIRWLCPNCKIIKYTTRAMMQIRGYNIYL